MSFSIHLMKYDDPYNKIVKVPVTVAVVTGELKDNCTIVDPEIMIEYDHAFIDANYAHIPDFGRYYFIKNAESVSNGLWNLTMHTDVLFSFQQSILNSPAVVARSSNNFNMMLNDDHYHIQENPYIFTKTFPGGFDTSLASYVLALVGVADTGEEEGE